MVAKKVKNYCMTTCSVFYRKIGQCTVGLNNMATIHGVEAQQLTIEMISTVALQKGPQYI